MFIDENQIQNQAIFPSFLNDPLVEVYVKREDQIHPLVSGNKFRKLKYSLLQAQQLGYATVLTFGGAFSNHIAATAAAGKLLGFQTIGVIRGDELANDLSLTLAQNATLREAKNNGMQLHFVNREVYRSKENQHFINTLKNQFGNFYLIPEGGTNELAIKGCEEILTKEDEKFDYICVAVGTGGTIAGLINSSKDHQHIIGFPVLKGSFLRGEIEKRVLQRDHWHLEENFHFGGYAKSQPELISFMNQFLRDTGIQLDPIYTGKVFFGLSEMIKNNKIKAPCKILVIHTGGLQGIEPFNKVLEKKQQETIQVI